MMALMPKLIRGAYPVLAGMLGALLIWSVIGAGPHQTASAPVATVAVQPLLKQFVARHARSTADSTTVKAQARRYSQALDATLTTLARERGVLLLPADAALAGAPDWTPTVRRRLARRLHDPEGRDAR